jgi:predicted small lipoprotein YifL
MRNVCSLGAVVFVLLASACGQKGPLVLPDAQKQRSAKPAAPAAAPAAASAAVSPASDANDPAADAEPASAPAH